MTRSDWNILMLSLAAAIVLVMTFAAVAQAAPFGRTVTDAKILVVSAGSFGAPPVLIIHAFPTKDIKLLECDGKMHSVGTWIGPVEINTFTASYLRRNTAFHNARPWERRRVYYLYRQVDLLMAHGVKGWRPDLECETS